MSDDHADRGFYNRARDRSANAPVGDMRPDELFSSPANDTRSVNVELLVPSGAHPEQSSRDPATEPEEDVAARASHVTGVGATTTRWDGLEIAKLVVPTIASVLVALGTAGGGYLIAEQLELGQRELLTKILKDEPKDGRDSRMWGKQPYIRVYLTNNITVEGWPFEFQGNGRLIYLSPACEIKDGKATLIAGAGSILESAAVTRLDILDRVTSACATAYEAAYKALPK